MAIEGYGSATSVRPGGRISFHLGSDGSRPERAELLVERIGDPSTSRSLTVDVEPRRPPTTRPWEGYDWPATTTITVSRSWPSGFYRLVRIVPGGRRNLLSFVVRPRSPGSTSKVLFHISYLTPAAYNSAGGKSFYRPVDEVSRAHIVSLRRPSPYPRLAHDDAPDSFIREAKLVEWLQEESIGIECCSSNDLHLLPDLLDNYDCLVLGYHDEYWTKPMRDRCERFVRRGGNMIVLSGNTCYRQVRLDVPNQLVTFHKYAGRDPHPDPDEATVAWSSPPVNRPQNELLGVGFTAGAYSLSGDRRGYRIHHRDHWVFDGVTGDETGAFMHHEVDGAAIVEEPEGYQRVTGEDGSPLTTTVLASADMTHWSGKPGRATMAIHSRNGTVFNAATTDWLDALSSDEAVRQITKNVFGRLGRPQRWDWEHIGHANGGTAMASAGGRLFLSSRDNTLWRRFPVGADVPWAVLGHANNVVSMAGAQDALYCLTPDNGLWRRPVIEVRAPWSRVGEGGVGFRAIGAAGGMLYATDADGRLWRAAIHDRRVREWETMGRFDDPTVTCLTSYGDMLLAATEDNRLLRTDRDFIAESESWHPIHHCHGAVGLAVVDWMLYVATSEFALWQIDLSGLRQP